MRKELEKRDGEKTFKKMRRCIGKEKRVGERRNASFCLCKMKPFACIFHVASTFEIKYKLLHV